MAALLPASAADLVPLAAADPTSEALSGVTSVLAVPVHVVAVLLLIVLLYEVGALAGEWWRRIRPSAEPLDQLAAEALAEPGAARGIARLAPGPLSERAVRDLAAAGTDPDDLEHALARFELRIQRKLDRTRLLVRAGPALGLMGTLIPLAPGLGALGKGDFQSLAGDLQTAFAATVVGILVGTGAYAVTLLRTRGFTEDLAALERAAARAQAGVGDAAAQPHHRMETTVGGDVR